MIRILHFHLTSNLQNQSFASEDIHVCMLFTKIGLKEISQEKTENNLHYKNLKHLDNWIKIDTQRLKIKEIHIHLQSRSL